MRTYNEYRETNNRYVFNRVRIPHESGCGYCGLGKGCNLRYRREYYWKGKRYNKGTGEYEDAGKYPSWKMTSKKRKQWMDDNVYLEHIEYHNPQVMAKWPDDYEIKW